MILSYNITLKITINLIVNLAITYRLKKAINRADLIIFPNLRARGLCIMNRVMTNLIWCHL